MHEPHRLPHASVPRHRGASIAALLVAVLVTGCREDGGPGAPDASSSDASPADSSPSSPAPAVNVGTWNLHNFSVYGTDEWRLDEIAGKVEELDLDLLAVQELKVEDGSDGRGEQAWDALVSMVPYEGIHNPWDTFDSTVGLLYDTDTTEVIEWRTLFDGDWRPFPRPPLLATVRVEKEDRQVTFDIIVVHLKAFDDSVDRRREACQKLDEFIRAQSREVMLIGDFNDDPYDPASANSFTGTFLDAEPTYDFVTASLPPKSTTSLGWYHWVNGERITGEFLDHAVITGGFYDSFESATPEIVARPESEYDWWDENYSDHFPVLVHLEP